MLAAAPRHVRAARWLCDASTTTSLSRRDGRRGAARAVVTGLMLAPSTARLLPLDHGVRGFYAELLYITQLIHGLCADRRHTTGTVARPWPRAPSAWLQVAQINQG
ncbi:hypothetical protein SEVIR_6G051601v4 [Setaria viridis]